MRNSKAFTLIELMVAMALFSMISITVFYLAFSSLKILSRSVESAGSLQTVRFIARQISIDIIENSGPENGSTGQKLVMGSVTYEFRDGKVRRQKGSDIYYLTTEGEIKDLRFIYLTSKLIRVQITGRTGGGQSIDVHARN